MEKYFDEMVLRERRKKKVEALDGQIDLKRDLHPEFLQTVVMCDGNIRIEIPAFLKDMPEELSERKYQYDPKPQIIKSTDSGEVNFTFSVLDVSVSPEELEKICHGCQSIWTRVLPELIFYEKGREEINGLTVHWMEYSNHVVGGKVYNLLFYAATERTLVGSINCPYNKQEVWMKVAKLCMRTLRGKAYDGETGTDSSGGEGTDGTGIYETAPGSDEAI